MRITSTLLLTLVAACGTNETPQPSPPATWPSCVPNRDGVITPDELPIAIGATLSFYVGADRTVSLGGNGVWDLSIELPGDSVTAIGPIALDTQWYATSFPAGQFVVDAGNGLDGIYHQDERGLWLDGAASHDPAPMAGKTLIAYATPLLALRFPIADGDAFTATAVIPTGAVIDGLPFVGIDALDVDVTLGARLDVPYVQFSPALRVRSHATRTPSTGTPVATKRTTSFLFECFGEVARAESNPNEPAIDFTAAAYLRRFALGK